VISDLQEKVLLLYIIVQARTTSSPVGRGLCCVLSLFLSVEIEKAEQLGKEEWEKGLSWERRKRSYRYLLKGKSLQKRDEVL
jgi:hypothetical protein